MGNTQEATSFYCCRIERNHDENEIKKLDTETENQLKDKIEMKNPYNTISNIETKKFQTTDNIIENELNNDSINNLNSPALKTAFDKKKLSNESNVPKEEDIKKSEIIQENENNNNLDNNNSDLNIENNISKNNNIDNNNIDNNNIENNNIEDNNKEVQIPPHDIPYWNEKNPNVEDEVYNINSQLSKKIFDFYNEVRLNPENFIDQADEYGLSDLLRKYNKLNDRPFSLIEKDFYLYTLCEILLSIYQTKRPEEDIKNDVLNNLQFKEKNKKLYYVKCEIEKYENAVWNLLKENENNAIEELLINKNDYCVIAAIPILNSYEMYVYFLFLSDE